MTFAGRALLADLVHTKVDATWGERVRIEPQIAGSFGETAPDPARPPIEVIGVHVNEMGDPAPMPGPGTIEVADIYLRVTTAQLATARPRRDDLVILLDRSQRYTLNRLAPASSFRSNLHLVVTRK